MTDHIEIHVDSDNRYVNGMQLSIAKVNEEGRGSGYRIAGPKYGGHSKSLLRRTLTERDAKQIRAMLDAVFPVEAASEESDAKLDVHTHFGLSYANYLVLPRTLLQSMPAEWQGQFVALLEQLNTAFAHVPQAEAYDVIPGIERTVSDMTKEELSRSGITKEVMGNGDARYFDENWNDQNPDETVFIEGADPVPHYNRGRTRIEPNLDGGR